MPAKTRPDAPRPLTPAASAAPAHGARLQARPGSSWVTRSDAYAQPFLALAARFEPEEYGRLGYPGVDEDVFQLPPDRAEREIAALADMVRRLERRLPKETDPEVRIDLEIMIDKGRREIGKLRLEGGLVLPCFNVAASIFQGIRTLLNDRVKPDRRAAARVRLLRYAGLDRGYTPVPQQAEATIRSRLHDPGLLAPSKDAVARDLAQSRRFVAAIGPLFERYRITGYEAAYAALQEQLGAYNAFLRDEILPRARAEFRLPHELYASKLQGEGVDLPVEELVAWAQVASREVRNEMQTLAALLARERGWPSSDYRDVIRELKKDQLTGEGILSHYRLCIRELKRLIEREGLLTLPDVDMRLLLATAAESAAKPSPHMRLPRLIDYRGEPIEFVLPLKLPGSAGEELALDDYTFTAASWTTAAHELMPGHAVQFAAMLDHGVSQARLFFAFNNTSIEGWAVYMEAEMKPYLPLAGQLISLQKRLLRSSRAALEPRLQQGMITREQALRILREEVVASEALARQEVERYTFLWPGQAPTYFCGDSRLSRLRSEVEQLLGQRFNRREYHDFLLAQGLLPLSLLGRRVAEEFVPQALEPTAG